MRLKALPMTFASEPGSGGNRKARSPRCSRSSPSAMTGMGLNKRATDQKATAVDHDQHDGAHRRETHDLVPGIEHGARGLRFDHQAHAAAQVEGLARRLRREEPREPRRRLAARLVGGGRRAIQHFAAGRHEVHLVGAHPAELIEELQHQVRTADLGVQRRQPAEQLRGHAIGRLDLLAHRLAGGLDLGRDQHDHERGAQGGHDEIQPRAQSHARMVPGRCPAASRRGIAAAAGAASPLRRS